MVELIDFRKITDKDGYYFTAYVPGASAATAANYGRFAAIYWPMQIVRVTEIHETAGTNASAVTLDVVVVENGAAISAGTSVLSSTFNLKSTANTLVVKEKRDLSSSRLIEPNQTLALRTSGTLTNVAGVLVTVYFWPYGSGSYR